MDIKLKSNFLLHEHYLLFDRYENQQACCHKCNLQINDVWAFTCETCNFWLHGSCALQLLPPQISHPLHSQHLLSLFQFYYHLVCDKCLNLTAGCVYRCRNCDFKLDLICASSTSNYDVDSPKHESQTRSYNQRSKSIQHFSHQHKLSLFNYRKVGKDEYCCYWCEKLLLSEMSYGCLRASCVYRGLFFHESCLITMPTIISKHHFHPSHPLHLQPILLTLICNACTNTIKYAEYAYTCKMCKFYLHIGCVAIQPSIKHELHEHPLTYFRRRESTLYLKCMICNVKFLIGESSVEKVYYRCVQCDFDFHFSCLSIPPRTKHKYHRHELTLIDTFIEDASKEYYCDICERKRKPKHRVYYCKECKFVAHIGCALNKFIDTEFEHGSTSSLMDSKVTIGRLMEQDQETKHRNANFSAHMDLQIDHFDHVHPLTFNEVVEQDENLLCEACCSKISSKAYSCKSCKYHLHKACTQLPYEVLHPLHSQHSLKLLTNVSRWLQYPCYVCRSYCQRFAYLCSPCDFLLHVKCANTLSMPKYNGQRLKDQIGSRQVPKLCLFNQGHELDFVNYGSNLKEYNPCSFCDLNLDGPSYACFNCQYQLHERCLGIPKDMELKFHPQHPFRARLHVNKRCLVCKLYISKMISYSCGECDLHLHSYCARTLKRAIKSKSHMHSLYYFGSKVSRFNLERYECGICKECLSSLPYYFCMECGTNGIFLHFNCAPIPDSVKSKYHIHFFTLKDHFIEDDSEKYYCDICEEERYPDDHVYYCTECQESIIAHIDCVLNSVEEEIGVAKEPSSSQAEPAESEV